MIKKIAGIIICILFLLSSVPIISGANINKNSEKFLLKSNDSIGVGFSMYYGKVVYNGEEKIFSDLYYNITPIRVIWFQIIIGLFPHIGFDIVTEDPYYIPIKYHGVINNETMFLWYIGYA